MPAFDHDKDYADFMNPGAMPPVNWGYPNYYDNSMGQPYMDPGMHGNFMYDQSANPPYSH